MYLRLNIAYQTKLKKKKSKKALRRNSHKIHEIQPNVDQKHDKQFEMNGHHDSDLDCALTFVITIVPSPDS